MLCERNFKVYLIRSSLALGGFLFGYHTGVISGILTMTDFKNRMKTEGEQASAINGSIVGILLFGCFLGSLIGGQISDRFSRKYSIFIFSTILTISTASQAASYWLSMLLVSRFISGISIGALSMIVPAYHSEIAATEVRARLITLQQWAITIGIAISFWVNYITHNDDKIRDHDAEWRIPLGLQIIPSSILSIGILFCPFSPRWLISVDREQEARNVLKNIRSVSLDEINEEINRIKKELVYLRENEIESYDELFHFPLLHPFLLGIGLHVLQQLTGINSTMYYAPKIFKHLFPDINNASSGVMQSSPLFATGINGLVNVIATIPTIIFIDKLERRIVLIAGAIIMSISMLIVGILIVCNENKDDDIISISWIKIIFIYIFVGGFAFSWGPIPSIYCTEIFPLRMRAKATSLTTAANWATNCAISLLVPTLLKYSQYGTFIMFSIFCAITIGLVFLFYSETKNIDLERNYTNDTHRIFIPQWLEDWRRFYFPQQSIAYNETIHLLTNEQNSFNRSDQIKN